MSVKFFGQFLLERGKIIREELLDALELQQKVNVKLGAIAVDAGYLTAKQIEEICQRQQQSDKMFGEIAVELNYLTDKQVMELLSIQKNERLSLAEALMQKGYLTLSDLEQELAEFKKSQEGVSNKVYLAVKEYPTPCIPETFLDLTLKFFRRLVGIDLEVIDSHRDSHRIAPYLWNISQGFRGDSNGMVILSMPDQVFLKAASHVAQEKLWEIDEFAKDSVREFVNIVAGNVAAKLSHSHNIHITLHPPKFFTSLGTIEIPQDNSAVVVKLASAAHELQNYTLQISLLYLPTSKKT